MAVSGSELFLVRVWAEPREIVGQPSVYRGRVEHVGTSRYSYFSDLLQAVAFIDECLAESDLPSGGFQAELED